MRRKDFLKSSLAFILIYLAVVFIWYPSPAFASEISFDLPDSLKVTHLSHYVGKFKGKDRLIFEMKVKNISNKEHRYRLRISLNDGASAGMLVPRKGKPPVIKPGTEKKIKLPFLANNQLPEAISILFMEFGSP